MKKIWLVTQESNINGEIMFNVVPCASKEIAESVLKKEVNTLLNEGHFAEASAYMQGDKDMEECCFAWENESDDKFYIEDLYDTYYEYIQIEEKEVYEKI